MSDNEEHDPLELEALDTEPLLKALMAVEQAIPELLLDVKPILAHLVSPTEVPDETKGEAARDAIQHYMETLDKIQKVLRYTVFFMHGSRTAPSVLRPPPINGLPRPMATTLDGAKNDFTGEATLGLYGARQEVAALREVLEATQAMRAQVTENKAEGEGESGEAAGDSIEVD